MKKTAVLMMAFFMFSLVALLGACGRTNATTDIQGTVPSPSAPSTAAGDTSSAGTPGDETAPASALPADTAAAETDEATPSPPQAGPFVFEEQTYVQDSISIKYPQIVGLSDTALQDELNGLISGAALQGVDEMEAGTEYEAAYEVTYNTPDVISIYFDSYYYVPDTAHPGLLLSSVTIDVAARKTVSLGDLVTIDGDFAALLRGGEYSSMNFDMTDETRTNIEDYLNENGDELLINELINADTSVWSAASYLTKDALVVSVSVAHVMGDHIEISLGYDELAPFKTDNPVWDTVG